MLKVENVSKKFTKEVKKNKTVEFFADKNLSFEAKPGEILGIIGPNGAGKTTLLRMIAGIMTPTEGSVSLDGLKYNEDDIEIKKQISFLSGNTKLYKDLSARELLSLCGDYYKIPVKEKEKRINKVIKQFKMETFADQRISDLSTGQTQRVGLARCVLHDPKYYILDEATSGLDLILSKIVLDFIKEEKKNGKCIIYSTHYMEEAETICDRVVIISKGEIVKIGTPEEIKKETKTTNLRDAFFALVGGTYE